MFPDPSWVWAQKSQPVHCQTEQNIFRKEICYKQIVQRGPKLRDALFGLCIFLSQLGLSLVGIKCLSLSVVDMWLAAHGGSSAKGHRPTPRKHARHKLRELVVRGAHQPQRDCTVTDMQWHSYNVNCISQHL